MNDYTKNISRLEFSVTWACSGRCRHCSEGEHTDCGEHLSPEAAAKAVRELAAVRKLTSVMTFGGEPMLYPETVYAVHSAAKELGIPKRQLITNGFFSRNIDKIAAAAVSLAECGVNDVLISADAFHQEFIPLEPVRQFALQAKKNGLPVRVHPAWLVSAEDNNPYNQRTREILAQFEAAGIAVSDGNVIFPSGNALKNLSEYFDENTLCSNPYEENPTDLRAVSISPDGSILGGNIHETGIAQIIEGYRPDGSAAQS